jgi:hypothetical protein
MRSASHEIISTIQQWSATQNDLTRVRAGRMVRPARLEKGHTVSVLFLPEQVREVRCCFLENTWVKETAITPDLERGAVQKTRGGEPY